VAAIIKRKIFFINQLFGVKKMLDSILALLLKLNTNNSIRFIFRRNNSICGRMTFVFITVQLTADSG
jgi:hypothetical protein